MKFELEPLLLARAGSWRYGYVEEDSDRDFMVLTSAEDRYEADLETGSDYFLCRWRACGRGGDTPCFSAISLERSQGTDACALSWRGTGTASPIPRRAARP